MTGTLHEDRYTFIITTRTVLLVVRNLSDRIRMENQDTFYVQITFPFFPPKNRAVPDRTRLTA